MTAEPLAASPAPSPADWLKAAAGPWRRMSLIAGLITVADVLPAIGFAAGLTLALTGLERSPVATAPGLLLAVLSLILRGLINQAGVVVGSRLGRAVKTEVRGRLLADLFGRGRRSADRITAIV